ncbi:hypothetical protein CIL07_00725 [Lacticaseibacillus paracasei subsp. paracasei]|uniref:hypothetical protein n=1 Tax=Lacticaseibacillus paracasei TaxID=1597 RepID=UPI000CD23EBB|nr:hypothetical protein [Lacticaseibacillus paracasei]NVO34640.1 hypothetical protein [Lacticaseibacillus paracasei subsp. paracasei]
MADTEKSNSETLAETIKAIFDPLTKQLHDLEAAIPEATTSLRKIEGSLKVEDVKQATLLRAQLEALKSAHLKALAAIETAKKENADKLTTLYNAAVRDAQQEIEPKAREYEEKRDQLLEQAEHIRHEAADWYFDATAAANQKLRPFQEYLPEGQALSEVGTLLGTARFAKSSQLVQYPTNVNHW